MTPRRAAASRPGPSLGVEDRLVATASELFYREGVRAVGIQRVIEEAGVAKASLYAHFESKDELVAACLDQRISAWQAHVETRLLGSTPDRRQPSGASQTPRSACRASITQTLNWGGSLHAVEQGVLPTFLVVDNPIPLVATRDVGTAAARLLAEGGSGKRVIELAGPREYSPRDVAAAVGRIVGKPIDVQQAPDEAMAPALMGAGMNAEWAHLFQALTHGLNTNIVVWEGGHPFWRGETDLQTVLSTLLGK